MTHEKSANAVATLTDAVSLVVHLFAFVSVAVWGLTVWPGPLNWIVGLAAPVLAIVLWGLFQSPRAVFRVDPYGKALVEIIVLGSGALSWGAIGYPLVGVVFGLIAATFGLIGGLRELA